MHGQIYFPKSSSTKHFTNSVETHISNWRLVLCLEWFVNLFHDIANFLRSWTKSFEFTLFAQGLFRFQELTIESFLVNIWCNLSNFVLFFLCDQRLVVIIHVSKVPINASWHWLRFSYRNWQLKSAFWTCWRGLSHSFAFIWVYFLNLWTFIMPPSYTIFW